MVNNPLGKQTQSSVLTVNPFSLTTPKPVPNFINNEVLIIYIVGFVCGAVVLASMIWLIVCTCKHKPCGGNPGSNIQVSGHRRSRSYDKTDSIIGGVSGLPLTNDYQIRKPMVAVVANQYTSTHRLDPRKGSLTPDQLRERGRLLEPTISRPEEAVNIIRDDEDDEENNDYEVEQSSEKDSGTGDSQCVSREHLVDEHVAKHGGGESTMSLTEFESTDLTRLDDDTIEEENSEGCGEAILSASNSILTDSSRTSVDVKDPAAPPPPSTKAHLRTFKPQRRSLSRDFLNCEESSEIRTERPMRKRGSAIELNGEKYLLIENHGASVAARDPKMDPHVYRGGGKPQSGLEFNEKLLEHSLNSTDYSLQSRRQRSKILAAQVHSLPRKPKKAKNDHLSQTQSPKSPNATEEIYATVALKADDKLF